MKITNIFNTGVNPSSITISSDGKYGYVCNSNNYGIDNASNITVLDLDKKVTKMTINDISFNEPYRSVINHNKLYVTNSGSTTVTIIDLRSNTVTGVIDGFNGPSAIVSLKNMLYVSNYGAGNQSGEGNTISVIDTITNTIVKTILVDLAPTALAFSSCNKYLYSLNYINGIVGSGSIDIIDLTNNVAINRIDGFFGPFDIVVSKHNKAYVTNFGSNNFSPYGTSISVVDLNTHQIIKNIEIGIQPSGIALSEDEKYIYVSTYNALYAGSNFTNLTYGEGSITKIKRKNNKVVGPIIKVGQTPSTLKIYNNTLYCTNYVSNIVQCIKLDK